MGKSNPLSPRSIPQPATFCHLPPFGEQFQQSKINPEDVFSLENNRQSSRRMSYPGSSGRRAKDFKFSVSRLPKWAQAKVRGSNIVCGNINNTLSEVYMF